MRLDEDDKYFAAGFGCSAMLLLAAMVCLWLAR